MLLLGGLAASAVAARPLAFGGTSAFLILSGLVGGNALYGQAHVHPQPMLATRALEAGAMLAAAGAQPAAEPWRPRNDPRIMSVPLVREVQELLREAGYYEADLDGRPGQATDRAIRSFQAERGLRVDGMATPLLLTQIRQMTTEPPSPEGRPGGDQYASLDDLMSDMSATGAIPARQQGDERELVRQIQSALTQSSVAELAADGIAGAQTRAAIRTYQELSGLEVTGEPTAELLDHLSRTAN